MNLIEITNRFPTELDAVKYFEKIRWGNKPVCAYCGSENIGARNMDFRFHCKDCQKSFKVTTNTKLHRTRILLRTWLFGFSIVSDAKKGLSALQLNRNLDITYKTSWAMYHKMPGLMEEPIGKLDDIVEIDETFVGGKPRHGGIEEDYSKKKKGKLDERIKELEKKHDVKFINPKAQKKKPDTDVKRGRGSQKKIPIVGMVERDGNVIAQVMKTLTYENLKKMVQKHVVEEESVLGAVII